MRWRVLLFVSLGANLVLAALWLRPANSTEAARSTPGLSPVSAARAGTNVLIHKRFFSWSELESEDYPTYIANLRAIGCPEQTIRDIIIADVNTLFARRLATEIVTPEQEWWRSQPDTNVVLAAARQVRALETERLQLLTELLGENWESGDLVNLPRPSRPGVVLDGPVLGSLPTETKQALQEISVAAQERFRSYLEKMQQDERVPDPAELARLRQQTREELARVLTPAQLEEYLLRYSQNANDLRSTLGELAHFNASADEFRMIFRARDSFDQQLALVSGDGPASAAQRAALEQQRENAIRTAIGAERYEEYRLLHDPLYRDAVAAAQEADAPGTARDLYQIALLAAEQQAALLADTNLTPQQREIQLRELELQQLRATAQITGQAPLPDLPPAPEPAPLPPGFRAHSHTLSVGESVASVALRYGVSMDAIRSVNPDVDLRRLRPGDRVIIPHAVQGSPAPPPR